MRSAREDLVGVVELVGVVVTILLLPLLADLLVVAILILLPFRLEVVVVATDLEVVLVDLPHLVVADLVLSLLSHKLVLLVQLPGQS